MSNNFGDYRIAPLDNSTWEDFLRLRTIVYGSGATPSEVTAKFATETLGGKPVGFLAIAPDGTPAAYYGVFPLRLRLHGKIVPGAQSGDTMTHPEHRRKGLFIHLAERTYDECRQRGIQLLYGFPNPGAHPGFMRLGWKDCGPMERMSLAATPSLSVRLQRKLFPGSFRRSVLRALDRQSIRPEQVRQTQLPGECTAERDQDWFRYKLSLGNKLVGLTHGKSLLKVSDYGILVGDCFDVSDRNKFWLELKSLAEDLGAHSLALHHTPGLADHFGMPGAIRSEGLPLILLDLGAGIGDERPAFSSADYDTF